jgi:macrolide-specific efflux system membrane fusion protein
MPHFTPRGFASKRSRFLLFLALAAGAALLFWPGDEKNRTHYEYIPVSRGTIEETVTAQGELEPKEFVDVGTQVSGLLQTLHIEVGDAVKKGQLIAEIDPRLYEAQVEASEAQIKTLRAQLAEQQANLAFTKNVYARNSQLMRSDAVSREVLQSSEMEYKSAQARIASYEAQIKQAESQLVANKTNLGFTKIYAPMDGTVVSQTSKQGQTLNANQVAPVIVQVANLATMTAKAQVAEADVQRLKPGMDVYFNTLGSDRRWNSTLRQLLPSPDTTVTDVVLYNALVDVSNDDRALMTGMSTQMFFLLGQSKDALLVPVRALGKKLPAAEGKGEQYELLVKTKHGVEPRTVEIGLMNRNQAEVRSGLGEQDQVAVATSGASDDKASARPMPRI